MADQIQETAKKIFDGMAIAATIGGVIDTLEQGMKDPKVLDAIKQLEIAAFHRGAIALSESVREIPAFVRALVQVKANFEQYS